MGIPVLLAATATKWASPTRLPYELSRAGFDVQLIAPKEALVAQSRFVARFIPLPDSATPRHWTRLLAATVEAQRPRLIVPCDDATLHLMMLFVESPPEDIDADMREGLRALIVESLGDPEHYRASVDKTLLPSAAAALGVRVPPHAVISDLAAARVFAAANGYPVVLKRAFGTAGQAVAKSSGAAHRRQTGRAHAGRTDIAGGEQHLIAEFPQEWLRDPESPYLRSARTDIPWNDPAVFCAMVAMRGGS